MTAINRTVLMSDARHFSCDSAINPYYGPGAADVERASQEHAAIRGALIASGVEVVVTESPEGSQDGVYTANWALVRGDDAVMARLPEVRRAEEEHAAAVLASLGKRIHLLPADLRFSGQGDALPVGDLLLCGQGYRSDPEAQQTAAEILGYERVQLQTIPQTDSMGSPVTNAVSGWPDSFFYDIDLALAVIRGPEGERPGLIAYCPEAFTPESREIIAGLPLELVEVSLHEAEHAFATNLVSTGEHVVMSAHAPALAAALTDAGLTVHTPEVAELAKGGGYIRCTTLTLD